jgi:hypothetical protein
MSTSTLWLLKAVDFTRAMTTAKMLHYFRLSIRCVILLCVVAATSANHAQTSSGQNASLSKGFLKPTRLEGNGLLGQAHCDSDDNIYLRTSPGDLSGQASDLQIPVVRLSRSGAVTGRFEIAGAQPVLLAADFFVSSGNVYELTFRPETRQVYLARFSADGEFQTKTLLDARFQPYQLAVFKSGEVLASGLSYSINPTEPGHAPFTGLFSADGKLLKQLIFPEDEYFMKQAAESNPRFVSPNPGESGNLAVEYGAAEVGEDDNAYLMRWTQPAMIYVISPDGLVRRTLRMGIGADWLPIAIKTFSGRLAIVFQQERTAKTLLKIFDLQGKPLQTIPLDPAFGEALSCYSGSGFVFAGSIDSTIHLYTLATP